MKSFMRSIGFLLAFVFLVSCSLDNSRSEPHYPSEFLEKSLYNYSSFSQISNFKSQTAAKGIASGPSFVGYNFKTNSLEEIAFIDDTGDEWSVSDFRRIGDRYLHLRLHNDEYNYGSSASDILLLIDMTQRKAFDITASLGTTYSSEYIYEMKDGLIFNTGGYQTHSIAKLDVTDNTLERITTSEFDGNLEDFYATHSGHVVAGGWDGNNYVTKYFPADGSAPLTSYDGFVRWKIRYHNTSVIGSPDVDYLLELQGNSIEKYNFTDAGIVSETIPLDKRVSGRTVFSLKANSGNNPVNIYHPEEGVSIQYLSSEKELVFVKIVDGKLEIERYDLPETVSFNENDYAAVVGDYLVYELTNHGLFCCNYKTGKMIDVCNGPVAYWNTTGEGIIFTKYITATSLETSFYDFGTSNLQIVSNSRPEVIKAVWFDL